MNPVGHAGHSSSLGATVLDGDVNFSLFPHGATGIERLLFDWADDTRPARVLRLDPGARCVGPAATRPRSRVNWRKGAMKLTFAGLTLGALTLCGVCLISCVVSPKRPAAQYSVPPQGPH